MMQQDRRSRRHGDLAAAQLTKNIGRAVSITARPMRYAPRVGGS
jgi:hypothetical protein